MAKVIRYTKYGYEIYDTETMSYKMLDSSYTYVSDFDNGFAKVTIKEGSINKYGYIDESGKEVVPTIYDEISEVYKGCIFARKGDGYYSKYRNEWYIININRGCSEKIAFDIDPYTYERTDFIRCVGEGVITLKCSMSYSEGYIIKHYKVNKRGELEPFLNNKDSEITFISNYCNHIALAQEKIGNKHSYYNSKSFFVIIDDNGNVLQRLNDLLMHRYIEGAYHTFGCLTHVQDSIYKYFVPKYNDHSPRQDVFIDIEANNYDYGGYDYCDRLASCGLRRVYRQNKGWGYINENGIEVIACQYRKAAIFVDNIAKVETDLWPCYRHIDVWGEIVPELPVLYNLNYRQDFATFNIGNIKATVDRGLRNYCRYQNTELYISGFLAIDSFIDGVAIAVDKDMRCGIIDIGGNKLSEFIYDNIYDDGKYLKTHIGPDKELFCSNEAWSITLSSKKEGNKYGYLSRTGEVLVKCEYDYLSQIDNGVVRGYKDGKLYIIDIAENKSCYYTLDNWLIDIGKVMESYLMHGDICPFLSKEERDSIIGGVKSDKWRNYFHLLITAVDNYISSLDLSNILDSYRIKYEVDTYCRPGDKDDDCDAYLISNFKDNQDVYLNSLLLYHKVLFSASHYGAWVKFCSWQKTEECQKAKSLASTLTEEKINYFKQHYSKEEHRKTLVKHIHNELKKKAIAEEIKKWIEPYKNMVK